MLEFGRVHVNKGLTLIPASANLDESPFTSVMFDAARWARDAQRAAFMELVNAEGSGCYISDEIVEFTADFDRAVRRWWSNMQLRRAAFECQVNMNSLLLYLKHERPAVYAEISTVIKCEHLEPEDI